MERESSEGRAQAPSSEKIARELRWHGLGQVAGELAYYAMVLVLAALLEPRAFGIVAVGMVIVRVAALFAQEGTAGSIIAAPNLTRSDVYAALRLNVALGVVLTVAVVLCAEPLAESFADGGDSDVLAALAIVVVLACLSAIPAALLRKALDFRRFSLVTAGAAIGTSACAIVAALLGAGVWALVARQVLYQAFVAIFGWAAARPVLRALPQRNAGDARPRIPPGRAWFFLLAASGLLAMAVDNLIVGAFTDVTQLGLYSLAFTLGFAPLTQISWRIGQVLFPAAAATTDLDVIGRRTVRMVRIVGLLLLPLAPLALALAPAALPALFGNEWEGMVAPFQVLILVGSLHALLNPIGEGLSGTGNIGFRARVDFAWAVLTLALVAVLAAAEGIKGAAFAHLIAFAPLGAAYVVWGARKIGSDAGSVWEGLRAVAVGVVAQAAVTVVVLELMEGEGDWTAGTAAAAAGVGTLLVFLWRAPSNPLADARGLLATVRG